MIQYHTHTTSKSDCSMLTQKKRGRGISRKIGTRGNYNCRWRLIARGKNKKRKKYKTKISSTKGHSMKIWRSRPKPPTRQPTNPISLWGVLRGTVIRQITPKSILKRQTVCQFHEQVAMLIWWATETSLRLSWIGKSAIIANELSTNIPMRINDWALYITSNKQFLRKWIQ